MFRDDREIRIVFVWTGLETTQSKGVAESLRLQHMILGKTDTHRDSVGERERERDFTLTNLTI